MGQVRGLSLLLKDVRNSLEGARYTTDELKKGYVELFNDPTEVEFVDKYLDGDFGWWERCKATTEFSKIYKEWRTEARQRYLQKNLRGIVEIAADEGNKARFSALKYLCDTGFVDGEEKRKAGRPSKAEVEGAKEQLLREDKELGDVFERMGISVGNG